MRTSAAVVVIGGGIIGCSTAHELALRGVDVLLLERHQIASGASGRNHGLIMYPQNPTTGPLYRVSHEMYSEAAGTSSIQVSLDEKPRGLLTLVAREDEWEAAEEEAKSSAEGGVNVEPLDSDALLEAEPHVAPGLLGAWWIDDGYILDPAALTLHFALAAGRQGAEVRTNTEVKQIVARDGRVTGVATDDGLVETPLVVVAAGPWISRLARIAGMDIPIAGVRGWLLLTRRTDHLTNHLLESARWRLKNPGPPAVTVGEYAGDGLPSPATGVLIQQNPDLSLLIGGSRGASLEEHPEGSGITRDIARAAAVVVPSLAGVPLMGAWSGVRPMSPDNLPLIGWVPGMEGLFVAGGHGGQGVMLGGGTGRLAAQLIAEEDPFTDPAPFDPGRLMSQ